MPQPSKGWGIALFGLRYNRKGINEGKEGLQKQRIHKKGKTSEVWLKPEKRNL